MYACVRVCDVNEEENGHLKEPRAPLDLVATPLRQSVEFGSSALQYRLEFGVGQMSLEIATIHVGRQPVIGDNE